MYERRWACHVVGIRGVMISAVQSVGAVSIYMWMEKIQPKFCLTRECLPVSRGGVQVTFRNRPTATRRSDMWRIELR